MTDASPESTTTILEQIGGEAAVEAVVEIFYGKVLGDDQLADYFIESDMDQLKKHQARFVAQALGGTRPYSGRSMQKAHEGRGITGADFDRVVEHLAASLVEAGVDGDTIGVIAGALAPLKGDIVTG
ncbi:group 1 truncated hemoglobin [Glycomyces sp. YM15]|uniref:group I truncated hemoglobin n=1 Tax=Glycomyces sp. YM15 TaxID=2800446 RepID=UPI0019635918|nr:group 1 truncated hemoglobin [Glycomyces sp. YM15]